MALMIQVSELSFYTEEGRVILDNVSLRVERGEWLFLVGPPESGKTVFLKLLLGELQPRSGQILVNDRNVTRLSWEKILALRRSIGVLPQPPIPLARRTVWEGLLFKLRGLGLTPEEAHRKATEALEALGVQGLGSREMEELTPLDRALAQLALAIGNDPILLLADEPCSGLDEAGALTVMKALERLHRRKRLTILTATQDEKLAGRFGSRLVRLVDGRLVEPEPRVRPTAGSLEKEKRMEARSKAKAKAKAKEEEEPEQAEAEAGAEAEAEAEAGELGGTPPGSGESRSESEGSGSKTREGGDRRRRQRRGNKGGEEND